MLALHYVPRPSGNIRAERLPPPSTHLNAKCSRGRLENLLSREGVENCELVDQDDSIGFQLIRYQRMLAFARRFSILRDHSSNANCDQPKGKNLTRVIAAPPLRLHGAMLRSFSRESMIL